MLCLRCGQPLAEGSIFCSTCGTPVAQGRTQNVAYQQPPAYRRAPQSETLTRPTGITIAAVVYYAFGVMNILLALLFAFAALDRNTDASGYVWMALCLAFGGLFLLIGWGLWALKSWARVMAIVFSCIWLIAFPAGTIINGFLLYLFFRQGTSALFSGRRWSQLAPEDQQAIYQMQAGSPNAGVVIAVAAVGLIGVIAMSGIMAAIAIPNLLTAMQRSKQKRTMADIRSLSIALEGYAKDKNEYPQASTVSELSSVLSPTYIRTVPAMDGWSRPIQYRCWSSQAGNPCDHYAFISGGKDGEITSEDPEHFSSGATTNFDCDLVYTNGEFVTYPEGLQQ